LYRTVHLFIMVKEVFNLEKFLANCTLCPRECGADRLNGKKGYCGCDGRLVVSRAALHFWEEPCISGNEGSGTVFFSGCPLRCVYCQNREIALAKNGREISVSRLCDIFFELREKGANNINLVTPTHYIIHIIKALELARKKGLDIPVVYNTGGYEKEESIRLLEGLVDIYLPDFKYISTETAKKFSNAPDYPEIAKKAISEMHRQVGEPSFDERGMMKKGMIIRHLVLPGHIIESKKALKYICSTYGDGVYLSIMNQYTPMGEFDEFPELTRRVYPHEYKSVIEYASRLGIKNAFIQEGDTAKESFIPAFDNEGV